MLGRVSTPGAYLGESVSSRDLPVVGATRDQNPQSPAGHQINMGSSDPNPQILPPSVGQHANVPSHQYLPSPVGQPPMNNGFGSTPLPPNRPKAPLVELIAEAILSAPQKQLTLQEICRYIEHTYPYHRRSKSWKGTVRSNLSTEACFVKKEKRIGQAGNHWAVHIAVEKEFQKGFFHSRKRLISQYEERVGSGSSRPKMSTPSPSSAGPSGFATASNSMPPPLQTPVFSRQTPDTVQQQSQLGQHENSVYAPQDSVYQPQCSDGQPQSYVWQPQTPVHGLSVGQNATQSQSGQDFTDNDHHSLSGASHYSTTATSGGLGSASPRDHFLTPPASLTSSCNKPDHDEFAWFVAHHKPELFPFLTLDMQTRIVAQYGPDIQN